MADAEKKAHNYVVAALTVVQQEHDLQKVRLEGHDVERTTELRKDSIIQEQAMTSQPHPSHAALMDHVSRTRLAKSCESRDDSLSWNLSRVKQGGAIRSDDMDPQERRRVLKV